MSFEKNPIQSVEQVVQLLNNPRVRFYVRWHDMYPRIQRTYITEMPFGELLSRIYLGDFQFFRPKK